MNIMLLLKKFIKAPCFSHLSAPIYNLVFSMQSDVFLPEKSLQPIKHNWLLCPLWLILSTGLEFYGHPLDFTDQRSLERLKDNSAIIYGLCYYRWYHIHSSSYEPSNEPVLCPGLSLRFIFIYICAQGSLIQMLSLSSASSLPGMEFHCSIR